MWMYSYFCPRMLSGQLTCLKQATSYITVPWFPEAKEGEANKIEIRFGHRIRTIFTSSLPQF